MTARAPSPTPAEGAYTITNDAAYYVEVVPVVEQIKGSMGTMIANGAD